MRIIFCLFLFLTLSSCFNEEDEGRTLAKVGGEALYEKDIKGIFSEKEISRKDSLRMREKFINNWVKEQLIYQKALENLPDEKKNKEKELEDYYKSLIRFEYEKELLSQNISTNVKDKEVKEYYEENLENFKLLDPVVRLVFIHLPEGSPRVNKVEDWVRTLDQNDLDSLFNYGIRYGKKIHLEENKWFNLNNILMDLPLSNYNIEKKLNGTRFFSEQDSSGIYFINLLEYRKTGSFSPLEMVRETISKILINKKRVSFINEMEKDIYQEALKKNEFEIYE